MYDIFSDFHPPNALSKNLGIIQNCANEFKRHFPSYDEKILYNTAKMFTLKRLKKINEKFNEKKKKKKKKQPKRKAKKNESDDEESDFEIHEFSNDSSDDEVVHHPTTRAITTTARRM